MEQSDFSVVRVPDVELPASAVPVALPGAPDSNEAGEFATRWVLRIAMVLLAALAVLCAVGPHIPSGHPESDGRSWSWHTEIDRLRSAGAGRALLSRDGPGNPGSARAL